jgi:hypothetical protein
LNISSCDIHGRPPTSHELFLPPREYRCPLVPHDVLFSAVYSHLLTWLQLTFNAAQPGQRIELDKPTRMNFSKLSNDLGMKTNGHRKSTVNTVKAKLAV